MFDGRNSCIHCCLASVQPHFHFQMIGRGLRGIKNGGNDRCLILDVNDNIVNFERNLAFTELDWLWD